MNTTEYTLPPQTEDALTVTASGGDEDFPECPAGAWVGVCVDVVYRGLQENKFEPQKPPQHKISVHMMLDAYESDESDVPARRTDGKRFVLSAWFTRSMHPKANLRRMLENWRGKAFDDKAAETFDLNNLVGAPALVTVVHKAKKDGGTRAVIDSIGRLPRGMEKFTPDEYVRAKDRTEVDGSDSAPADDNDGMPF